MHREQRPPPDPAPRPPRWLTPALTVLALAAVAGVYLWLYGAHAVRVPVGYDTPKYVWRARLVAAQGMHALSNVPHGVSVAADRPGYPVLVALWSATLGAGPFRLAMIVPAVTAVMIACGAAGFAGACLLRPGWQRPLFALAVGASPFVALMAGGHADNLLLSVVAMAAAAAVLMAAAGERTIVASALLLGSGAAIHWNFALFVAAMIGVLCLALWPESRRARRDGGPWSRTPVVRVAGAVGAGAAVGAVALLLAPASPSLPGLSRHGFLVKLKKALPWIWWPVVVPAAVVGGIAIGGDARRDRRPWRALVFLLIWAAGAVVAVVALEVGASSPAHRVLEFALAIPILAAAGVLAAAAGLAAFARQRAGAARMFARATAVAIVLAAAVGTVAVATTAWDQSRPSIRDPELQQIRTAAEYVDSQPDGRPVVMLVDTGSGRPDVDAVLADHWLRLSVAPDRITGVAIYLGDLDRFLAGEPTVRGQSRFDLASRRFLVGTRGMLAANPSVIVLSTLDRSFAALAAGRPGSEVAPGLAVIRGPLPAAELRAASLPGRPPFVLLVLLAAGALAVAAVAGGGWARMLLPAGSRAWLAPAMGVATLVLAGTAADAAGFRLQGPGAVALVAVVACAGWLTAAVRTRRTTAP
ncbi:MAG TPA: hypothetical protein VNN79_10240 [Actinomycetota bacterium]|nr:hypothetical protein [Actinomycetota bacterium]